MKKFIITGLIICTLSFAARAQFISAELEVSGLTCSMCSLSTQKSLNTLDFIGSIKPDLNKNIFYIQFKPGKIVNLDAMKQKVVAAGFSVSKLIAIYNFDKVKVSDKFIFVNEGASYEFIDTQESVLSGPTRVQVLDKGFLPARVAKKYNVLISDPAILPGSSNFSAFNKNARQYHINLSK